MGIQNKNFFLYFTSMNREYLDALYKEFLNYEAFSFNAAKYSRYDKSDDEKFFYNGDSSVLFTGLSLNPDDVIIKPALSMLIGQIALKLNYMLEVLKRINFLYCCVEYGGLQNPHIFLYYKA